MFSLPAKAGSFGIIFFVFTVFFFFYLTDADFSMCPEMIFHSKAQTDRSRHRFFFVGGITAFGLGPSVERVSLMAGPVVSMFCREDAFLTASTEGRVSADPAPWPDIPATASSMTCPESGSLPAGTATTCPAKRRSTVA
jgi:hypothetical protein